MKPGIKFYYTHTHARARARVHTHLETAYAILFVIKYVERHNGANLSGCTPQI
jgi:hypothetical protein